MLKILYVEDFQWVLEVFYEFSNEVGLNEMFNYSFQYVDKYKVFAKIQF